MKERIGSLAAAGGSLGRGGRVTAVVLRYERPGGGVRRAAVLSSSLLRRRFQRFAEFSHVPGGGAGAVLARLG